MKDNRQEQLYKWCLVVSRELRQIGVPSLPSILRASAKLKGTTVDTSWAERLKYEDTVQELSVWQEYVCAALGFPTPSGKRVPSATAVCVRIRELRLAKSLEKQKKGVLPHPYMPGTRYGLIRRANLREEQGDNR